MKHLKKIKPLLSAILFAFMFFAPGIMKSQCGAIQNNLTMCQITVRVDIYTTDPMTGMCTVICASFPFGLGVSSTVLIPCGPCPMPICNVKVTVTHMNGVPIPPTTADWTSVPPGIGIPTPVGPCKPQPGSPNPRIQYMGGGLFRIVP